MIILFLLNVLNCLKLKKVKSEDKKEKWSITFKLVRHWNGEHVS